MQDLSKPRDVRPSIILGCLFAAWFWSFMLGAALSLVLPFIEAEFGVSHSEAGLLVTVQMGGMAAMSIPAGLAVRRVGARAVILVYLISASALCLVMTGASSYALFIIVLAALGLIRGLYQPAALNILPAIFPPNRIGRAIGIHDAAPPLASVVGVVLLSAFVLGQFDWRMAYVFLVPAGLLILLFVFRFVVTREPERKAADTGSTGRYSLLKDRELLWLLVPHTLMVVCAVGVLSMLPIFLVNEHGMTGQQAGFVYAGVSTGGIIGPLLGGWLSDRWSRLGTAVLYTGVCFASMLFIINLPSGLALYAALFVFMIVTMGYFLITWAIIVDRVPAEQRPPINGLFIAVSVAISTITPFIIGVLGDAFSLRVGFMYPAAAAFGGFIVLVYLLLRRPVTQQESGST